MKNSFDKIRNSLEEASPEDIGLPLDREKLWAKVEAKQRRKTIVFRPWLSHAAAVAAGLIVGIYFWSGSDNATPDANPAIVHQSSPAKPAQVDQSKIDDTAIASQASEATVNTRDKKIAQPAAIATSNQQQVQINEEPTKVPEPIIAEPPAPIIIASNTPSRSKQKVLHLADMKNENGSKQIMQDPNGKSFLKQLMDRQGQQEQSTETVSAIVAGYLKKHNN